MHKNICSNNCEFAVKTVLLSRAGMDEDWLHRCTKLENRLITTDSIIFEVGCATYTYLSKKYQQPQETIVTQTIELVIKEVERNLDEQEKIVISEQSLIEPVTVQVPVPEKKPETITEDIPVQKQIVPEQVKDETPVPIVAGTPKKRGRPKRIIPVITSNETNTVEVVNRNDRRI